MLNGLSLTNPTGAAIYVAADRKGTVVIADGTVNSLSDGTESTA